MPGYNSQRRSTDRTSQISFKFLIVMDVTNFFIFMYIPFAVYCLCVNVYYCHRVSTQLLLNMHHIIPYIISYHIKSYHISHHIIYHIIYHITSYHISYNISHHIIYHITSHHIYHIIYHITSYHMSHHIISYHISYQIISYVTTHYAAGNRSNLLSNKI
jgi:hypothetical protein